MKVQRRFSSPFRAFFLMRTLFFGSLLFAAAPGNLSAGLVTLESLDNSAVNFSQSGPMLSRTGTLQPGWYTFRYSIQTQSVGSLSSDSQKFSFTLSASASIVSGVARAVTAMGQSDDPTNTSTVAGSFDKAVGRSLYGGLASGFASQISTMDSSGVVSESQVFAVGSLAGPYAYPGLARSEGYYHFYVAVPTVYSLSGSQQSVVGSATSNPPGSSQADPVLPSGGSTSTTTPVWIFGGDAGQWYDPPLTAGFRYTMQSGSLFTSILDFPVGFAGPFTVSTGGTILGQLGPGQSVDFTQFGGGVTEFTVTGISPLADAASPVSFPIKLAFSTPTATFEMEAVLNTDNAPPVANAGADQTVNEGSLVTMNGTASSDPNNDPLTFNS